MAFTRAAISRLVTWPVFAVLAVTHIGVLPLVLDEQDQVVVSLIAGTTYAVLAAIDLLMRRHGTPRPW